VSSFCIEHKTGNFDQIIDELVELNKAINTPAAQIGRTVSQIRSAARDAATAFSAFYSKVKGNCAAGNKYLSSFSAKLKGDLVNANAGINSATRRVKSTATTAASLSKQVAMAKEGLEKSHERQAKAGRTFRQHLLEAEGKMTVIKHVRNIVVDELLNGKAPASLIQVNTITSKLQELKSMVQASSDSMFTTVVSSLLEMVTEKNLNDQKILRKFLGALKKLNDRIKAWRAGAMKSQKNLNKLNLQTNAAQLKSLRALGRLLVEAKSAGMAATRTIEELTNARGVLAKAQVRKTKETKNWNALCADQARVRGVFATAHKALRAKVQQVSASLLNLK